MTPKELVRVWSDPLGLRGRGFFHLRDGLIVFQRGYLYQLTFFRLKGLPVTTHYLGSAAAAPDCA